jgi:hypothetical protein
MQPSTSRGREFFCSSRDGCHRDHRRLSLQRSNSLLTGKRTGNFVKLACWARFCTLTREQIQRLAAKFPNQQNKELFRRNREFWRRNRDFAFAKNRNHRRMRFSVPTASNCGELSGFYLLSRGSQVRSESADLEPSSESRRHAIPDCGVITSFASSLGGRARQLLDATGFR